MKKVVSILVVLAFATAASAATTVSTVKSVSPDGKDSYVVTLTSDTGNVGGATMDITGAAIQNLLPFGMGSIFQDSVAPGAWAGALMNVLDDSLFLFNTAAVLTPGTETESATRLYGDISLKVLGGQSVAWARVVVPTGNTFRVAGTGAIVPLAGGSAYAETFDVTIPEPASMALLAFGGLGVLMRRKR